MRFDRETFLLYGLVAVACLAAAWIVAGRPWPERDADSPVRAARPRNIVQPRMASVELTRAQLGGEALISAFVATRSRSKKCLLTLAESSAAAPSTAAFCGYRRYRGANGVIVRIYLATPAPADLRMTVTVYHEGAKRYGKPILYVG